MEDAALAVRLEFRDEEVQRIYTKRGHSSRRFAPDIVTRVQRRLALMEAAVDERDFYALKSLHFEKLRGDREGQRSVRVTESLRLVFRIRDDRSERVITDIELVDYH